MAPRIHKIRHDENTRLKIKTAQIIRRLNGLIQGKYDMSPTAVSAALGLLRKTLPDLAATDLKVQNPDGTALAAMIVNQFIEHRPPAEEPVALLEPPSDSRH